MGNGTEQVGVERFRRLMLGEAASLIAEMRRAPLRQTNRAENHARRAHRYEIAADAARARGREDLAQGYQQLARDHHYARVAHEQARHLARTSAAFPSPDNRRSSAEARERARWASRGAYVNSVRFHSAVSRGGHLGTHRSVMRGVRRRI